MKKEASETGTGGRFEKELGAGAAAMGILLGTEAMGRFSLFFRELARWNEHVNLVSRKRGDWVRAHFLDSLAPLAMGLVPETGRVLDLGTGAGFPGIPLKLARPELCLGLSEASGKKCAWLRHILRTLGLESASVLEGRSELLLERGHAGAWDLLVSRAAARPAAAALAALPFVKPGGRLLVYTSAGLADEGTGTIHPYTVPGSDVRSVIWEVPS